MAQKLGKEKEEHRLAREQRQELKDELAEHFANRPRMPRNRRRIITLGVLGVIALLAVIFGILILLPASSQQVRGGVAVGAAAPLFTLPVYGGPGKGTVQVDLHALRGHPVVLNFWSESCAPCLSEIPYLRGINAQYGQGEFSLLGIDQGDPKDDIGPFGDTYKVNYPLLFDKGSGVTMAYGVTAIPTTYFIDSDGFVRSVVVQPLTSTTMHQGLASVGIIIP